MAKESIKKVSNDSASSYCKMPDGTLIQWATVTRTSGWNAVVQFSQVFVDSNFIPAVTLICNTSSINNTVVSKNTYSVTVSFSISATETAPITVNVIAIGRWK